MEHTEHYSEDTIALHNTRTHSDNGVKKESIPFQPSNVTYMFVALCTVVHLSIYIITGFILSWTLTPHWSPFRILACAYLTNCLALFTHFLGHEFHVIPAALVNRCKAVVSNSSSSSSSSLISFFKLLPIHMILKAHQTLRDWYYAHRAHHVEDYPPHRFLTSYYKPASVDNSYAYRPTIIAVPMIMCYLTQDWNMMTFVVHTLPGIFLLLVADYVHQQVHIKGSYWEQYEWFHSLRTLHYYHHRGSFKHNYAMADFLVDVLFLRFKHSME